MIDVSNKKGSNFENKVFEMLSIFSEKHSERVEITPQKEINMSSYSYFRKIDFEIKYNLYFEIRRDLVECQNRKKSSYTITDKIYYIKSHTNRNNFIYVYEDNMNISKNHLETLKDDGILIFSFLEFKTYINNISSVLNLLKQIKEKPEINIPERFA